MPALAEQLAASGTLFEVGSNQPFLLRDPQRAWYLVAGSVDVFAVPLHQGEPTGARTHLFRASAGQMLFGLPVNTDSPIGFLAVGCMGTRLRELPVARLQELGRESTLASSVAELTEHWIALLYGGVMHGLLPKEQAALEAGQETPVPAHQAAWPPNSTVWINLVQGSARLAAVEKLVLTKESGAIPLTPTTWIETTEDALIRASNTLTLLRQNALWPSLERFYGLIFQWAGLNLAQEDLAESARLAAKEKAARRAMSGAVAHLSALLRAGRRQPVTARPEAEPTLAACQLIGQRLGCTFRPQAESKSSQDKDPLVRIVAASRLRLRRVVLSENWWQQDNGPLLGYLKEDNQPVALLPVSAEQYEMADPVQQTRVPITAETAQALKPLAFTFYRPLPNRSLTIWDIIKFGIQGVHADLVTIALIGTAGGLLSLLTPIATGVIFDTIIPGAERSQLWQVTAGLFVAAIAAVLFQITRSVSVLRVETKSDVAIESAVWDRLLSLPVPFFRNYSSGDLAMRAYGINQLRKVLSDVVLTSVLAGFFSLFNFALLFYYSVTLALLASGLVAISVAMTSFISVFRLRYQRPIFKIQGKIAGMVLQFITGIAKLRVAGAEALAFSVWAKAFSEEKQYDLKTGQVLNVFNVFNAIFPLLTSLSLYAAMAFTLERKLSTGDFLAFNAAFGGFLGAMLAMSSSLISLLDAVPIYERAKPILTTLPEVDEARSDPGELHGRIELSHICFRYKPDAPLVLNDLSLQIFPGEFVAMVGPSGSGKSTLTRLLLGFESPEAGAIYYDGHDLAGLDLQAVRRQFGVVLQTCKLVPGTIFENIVGSSLLTLEDAWEAAARAGLDEDVRKMPMGMHTVLSEGGGTLSGGQRQRLMIARAIVTRPRILIFDEATSALDNRTQAIVSRSLEQLQATRIVIAHRLSTIMNADRIFVIQAGRLIQSGSYQELLKQPGTFAELAKRQLA